MTRGQIKLGSAVVVRYDSDSKIPNIGAKKYDGAETTVVKRTDCGSYGIMLELDGCISDKGIPYTFMLDDIELIREDGQ